MCPTVLRTHGRRSTFALASGVVPTSHKLQYMCGEREDETLLVPVLQDGSLFVGAEMGDAVDSEMSNPDNKRHLMLDRTSNRIDL